MGILARSWYSDSTRPIPVHVAEFESQPKVRMKMCSLTLLPSPRGGRGAHSLGDTTHSTPTTNWGILGNLMPFSGIGFILVYLVWFGGTGSQLSSLGWLRTPLVQVVL